MKMRLYFIVIFMLMTFSMYCSCEATPEKTVTLPEIDVNDLLDLDEVDEFVEENDIFKNSFKEYVYKLNDGENIKLDEYIKDYISYLKNSIYKFKKNVINIFVASILSGLCTNFFKGGMMNQFSVSTINITYLYISCMIVNIFSQAYIISEEVIKLITSFIKIVVPPFIAITAFSTGSKSATGFNAFIICSVAAVNILIVSFVMPLARIYMIINIAGNFEDENRFSNIGKLCINIAKKISKALIILICAISLIQKMILPYQDVASRKAIIGAVKNIPLAGSTISGIGDIIFSSAMLIRNEIGVVAIIFILIIASIPLIRLLLLQLTLMVAAAIVQPVCDKKISNMLDYGQSAISIMMMSVITCVGMFFLSIAIMCIN